MRKNIFVVLCTGLLLLGLASVGQAATTFFDDFEDGDYIGWSYTATGGFGSTGVTLYNGSQTAFAQQSAFGTRALSQDFSFSGDASLTFDMQAIPNYALGNHAASGVKISFLNMFNSAITSISVLNKSTGAYGSNEISIDNNWHNYTGTMDTFAAAAGLYDTSNVVKLGLSFFASAEGGGCCKSNSTVYFDNVLVAPVPLPAAVWLFGSALVGLGFVSRKGKV